MMPLSISTCWNSHRHTDGGEMLRELVDLGFERVELGHGVSVSLLEGAIKFVEKGGVRISSLHNFCPLPVEVRGASPNCYEFTSHRKVERERALRLSRQTIDFAQRLGASFVVLHMGRVPMQDFTRKLTKMAESGEFLSRKYVKAKLDAVRVREAGAKLYLDRAREALTQLAEYASARDIHLGVESREAYEELPSEREMLELIESAGSPFVGYWHDIGHVQVKENLAFVDHEEWLRRIRSQMLGCHLHDVEWPAADHRPPLTGSIDYDTLLPLMPDSCLFVWEISPRRKREEIVVAREAWLKKYPHTL